jgi:tRNA 2-selenouridine synthase
LRDTAKLCEKLSPLIPLQGHERVEKWLSKSAAGDIDSLILDLLIEHYDPAYTRSINKNFTQLGQAQAVQLSEANELALAQCARAIALTQ